MKCLMLGGIKFRTNKGGGSEGIRMQSVCSLAISPRSRFLSEIGLCSGKNMLCLEQTRVIIFRANVTVCASLKRFERRCAAEQSECLAHKALSSIPALQKEGGIEEGGRKRRKEEGGKGREGRKERGRVGSKYQWWHLSLLSVCL